MNKYYIKSQNNLTLIVRSSIAEMNKNVYDLSIKVDKLENENLILKKKLRKNIKAKEKIEKLQLKNDELLELYTTERNLKKDYKYKIDRVIKEIEKYTYYIPEESKNGILKYLKGDSSNE